MLTPTMFGGGAASCSQKEPELKTDPRFKLYPDWMQAQVAAPMPTQRRPGTARRAAARW